MPTALLVSIKDWLLANSWLIEATLVALLTIAVLVFWNKLQRKISQRSKKSQTPWDDIIIHALGTPLSLLIVVLGLYHIAGIMAFFVIEENPDADKLFSAIRQVVIVATFFWALLRIINGFESHYRHQKIKVGEKELNRGTIHAIFQSLRAGIFFIVVLTAMEVFGLSVSGLLAFGGVGGVVLGFAAKDTLANFFSGLLIFWERPFVVGDWIRRPDANIEGVVEDIGWRMTQIRTFDQRPLYVPNSLFFNSVIENPQRMTNCRIYEYMGICYDNIDKMPAVLQDIRAMLASHAGIDQEKIQMVNFDRYGASSLDFFVYAMTKTIDWCEYHHVKEEVLFKIATIVREHGCSFAFPTRTVHHVTAEAPPLLPQ